MKKQNYIFREASETPVWDALSNDYSISYIAVRPSELSDLCMSGRCDDGVYMTICRDKVTKEFKMQGCRFDKSRFTLESAQKWISEHSDMKPMKEAVETSGQLCEALQISETFGILNESNFQLEEASKDGKDKGSVWGVTIITEGVSLRKNEYQGKVAPFYYPSDVLAKSIPMFEGVQVFAHKGGAHVDQSVKSVHDEVGWLSDVQMVGKDMRAKLHVLPSATWLKENLLTAYQKGKKDLYQLSIHAGGDAEYKMHENQNVFYVKSFGMVDSVDIVPKGAAGGKFNNLIESQNTLQEGNIMTSLKLKLMTLATLFFQPFMESKNIDWLKVDENELFSHLVQADKVTPRMHLPDGLKLSEADIDNRIANLKEFKEGSGFDKLLSVFKESQNGGIDAKFQESVAKQKELADQITALQKSNCFNLLESKLANCKLPTPIIDNIRSQFSDKIFTEAEINTHISAQKELYAKLFPNKASVIMAESGLDERDKIQLGLDGMLLASNFRKKPLRLGTDEAKAELKGIIPFRSLREAYIEITGDTEITGHVSKSMRMTESIDTTQFNQVLADALNKAMVRDYSMMGLDTWRPLVDVISLKDFKTQHRIRVGGYPNLAAVTQSAAYMPMTTPSDEEVTYAATKRGGTEVITREAIMNDDLGFIQRIPTRMARAAAQTLHEFVFEFINPATNPTYEPDTTALYHSNHSNTGTTALDATSLAAARLRMKKQTQAGSSKRLALRGRYLIVPSDLEKAAYDLLTPAFNQNNQTPDFLQQIGVTPIVVDYWTDTNNWVLAADRSDVSMIELGFINGQETPEIFVSDLPNAGSWFTNDVITYKIRHEYGGDIIDYRGLDGSIVA